MTTAYRLQLGISPLSPDEAETALQAIRRVWQMPAWVRRQKLGQHALLLEIRHEAALRAGESPEWFAERLAAAVWQALGRFVRIAVDIGAHEGDIAHTFIYDEAAYWRILPTFRLSPMR